MQPSAEKVDTARTAFVGPCADADPGTWTRPEGAGTVLLVSLGSAYTHRPEFYRRCIAAYGNRPGLHVVLQIGRHTDPRELGDIPPNVEVHSWVPQRAVLDQADAFVTHAGMGGCGDGLRAGVPMIAVPQGAEQFMNADRLVELGVARRLDTPDATAESLWAALNDVLDDPEPTRRSARLRTEALSEGGTPRAVRLIEEMLEPVGAPDGPDRTGAADGRDRHVPPSSGPDARSRTEVTRSQVSVSRSTGDSGRSVPAARQAAARATGSPPPAADAASAAAPRATSSPLSGSTSGRPERRRTVSTHIRPAPRRRSAAAGGPRPRARRGRGRRPTAGRPAPAGR